MEMELVDSSLIQERGYDPAQQLMNIRFRDKRFTHGAVYQYGNVTEADYEEGCGWRNDNEKSESFGELSFGSWFQRRVKNNPAFPFRKIEDARNVAEQTALPLNDVLRASIVYGEDRIDFTASGQVLPAEEPLPEDREALVEKALQLQEKVRAITINSPEAYAAAAVTGTAVAAMQAALKKAFYEGEDGITARYNRHRELMTIFNSYNDPLESDKNRLRAGMVEYKRQEDAKALRAAREERERLQKIADDEAREKAEALKRLDVQAAKDAGDLKTAKAIEKTPAVPIPTYVAPVQTQSVATPQKGAAHVPRWEFEFVDERGEPVTEPRLDLIPREYIKIDDKAIGAVVRTLKSRTSIRGIRAFDAGSVRFSSKR
jgi:KTSC domain